MLLKIIDLGRRSSLKGGENVRSWNWLFVSGHPPLGPLPTYQFSTCSLPNVRRWTVSSMNGQLLCDGNA